MTKVTVDTKVFECAQGKAPRGRGGWAFSLGQDFDRVDELAEDGKARVLWFSGTYAEAKKQAVQVARERGFDCLVVCS